MYTISQNDQNFIEKNLSFLQKKMYKKKVLILGGTGFIGKWFLESFVLINNKYSLNSELVVLSRSPDFFLKLYPHLKNYSSISFIKGDIRDFKLRPSTSFDLIIHAATETNGILEKSNPNEMYSVIVKGTKHLINEIHKNNKSAKLLYISSGAVYGRQPPELSHTPENFPCSPTTAYGKGKLEAEKICLNSDIPCSIARCFAFVGPYLPLDIHFAIGNFILNGLKNEPIIINGDGTPYRSYMYTSDLVNWLWSILINGKSSEIYNVGSDNAISIAELADIVSKCFNYKSKIIIKQKPKDGVLPLRYVPFIDKAKRELGLNCKIGLDKAIKKTIQWNKDFF